MRYKRYPTRRQRARKGAGNRNLTRRKSSLTNVEPKKREADGREMKVSSTTECRILARAYSGGEDSRFSDQTTQAALAGHLPRHSQACQLRGTRTVPHLSLRPQMKATQVAIRTRGLKLQ